jgi:hypothetical protein
VIANGSIVLRKRQPPKHGAAIYGRSLDIDPEPFQVISRAGNNVGIYQIKSLVTGKIEGKWYKPYELHVLPIDRDILVVIPMGPLVDSRW